MNGSPVAKDASKCDGLERAVTANQRSMCSGGGAAPSERKIGWESSNLPSETVCGASAGGGPIAAGESPLPSRYMLREKLPVQVRFPGAISNPPPVETN